MAIGIKITPKNLLADWGEFEDWELGASDSPSGWSKTGTPTIAQEATTIKYGAYSLKLVGTNTSQKLYLAINNGTDYVGRTMKLGIYVKTAGAGVKVSIDDGVSVTDSSAHTGGNTWEQLTVTKQIATNGTEVEIHLNIPNGITAYYDNCILVEGEVLSFEINTVNYTLGSWKDSINIRTSNFDIARKEGIYIPETHLGSKTITIRGDCIGSGAVGCRTNFDTLINILRSWKHDEKRDLYLFDDRVKEVFLEKVSYDPLELVTLRRTYEISFIAENPTWRYINRNRKKEVISSSPTSFNLSYLGNTEDKPIIYFIADQGGDITSCLLENLTTGESVAFTATVSSGNTLKIDCDACEVLNNAVDSISSFSGDFMKLIYGTNYLKFTGSNCTIKVDWYNRWL